MSASRQLERIIRIDTLIRDRERQTSARLAADLGVTVRTIQSDLDFMRDRFGAPLEAIKPRGGWHYTDPSWRLPTLPLTEGELLALTLGAQMLRSYAGTTYHQVLQSAIARLAKRLPDGIRVNLQALANDRVYFRAGCETPLEPEIWTQLLEAVQQCRSVWMRYLSPKKGESERTIDPYALDVYRGSNHYVWGFCHERQAIRQFRLDRIRELRVLDRTFQRDPNFSLERELQGSFQYEVGGHPASVEIEFSADTAPYITERQWHETQSIERNPDGSIVLRFTASGLGDIKRWVLGYGKGAIVRSPPQLVTMLQDEIQTMSRQAKSGHFES
ncbi:MAG: helix-turn-helix transcriptional regulator [Geitlerinemataceae cyanobacterium]